MKKKRLAKTTADLAPAAKTHILTSPDQTSQSPQESDWANTASFDLMSGRAAIGGGQYRIQFLGIPGYGYQLEETASQIAPVSWTMVNPPGTVQADSRGTVTFAFAPSAQPAVFPNQVCALSRVNRDKPTPDSIP